MSKTVAEMLRGYDQERNIDCFLATTAGRDHLCNNFNSCRECAKDALSTIADMIEAEQAELRKSINVTDQPHGVNREVVVDALLKVAEEMEDYFAVPPYKLQRADSRTISRWENTIQKVIEGASFESTEPQLPEGIEWPRFEDGKLVKFGDEFVDHMGRTHNVRLIQFNDILYEEWFISDGTGKGNGATGRAERPFKRPEPEVLDAENVPIKVGDTVYGTGREQHAYEVVRLVANPDGRFNVTCRDMNDQEECLCDSSMLTHRKPDSQEAINADMALPAWDYLKKHGMIPIRAEGETKKEHKLRVRVAHRQHLLERQRKLMGGE